MGVVNVSPDSFSGDGVASAQSAASRAVDQYRRSADIVDLGAESTRPGHIPLPESLERQRLLPAISEARAQLGEQAILSADTFKPEIFRAAHEAGADIFNSIWGLGERSLAVALECNVPVVIMHNKDAATYETSVVDEMLAYLEEAAARAVRAGMRAEHVILDPGIGFGKTAEQNIAVLQSLPRLVALGFPTLLGTSRKSTIGKLTGREPHERIYGTAATVALAIAAGIDIVRVHDVEQIRDVVTTADAIERNWRPPGWT